MDFLVKKFVIKEAWMLDEDGKQIMKIFPQDVGEVFQSVVNEEKVTGGSGNVSNNT